MKIAMVGISLFNQGAEFVMATLAKGLTSLGHEVDVIVSAVHSDIAAKSIGVKPFDVGDRVKVIVLKSRRARHSIPELRKIFRGSCYDVVMCQASPFSVPIIFSTLLLNPKPKLVYVEHLGGIGTDMKGHEITQSKSLKVRFLNWINNRYDLKVAVSNGTKAAMSRMTGYPSDKIKVVANPVLDSTFEEKRCLPAKHKWLSAKSDKPVIVAAGALNAVKHFDLLIKAFRLMRDQIDSRLVIFGEGPYRQTYEKLISDLNLADCVDMPGFTNQLPAELNNASCFVVSSYVESFSIVLVEAMACGIPVVSVDAPYGPREILRNGTRGVLVENENALALSNGIAKALRSDINWNPGDIAVEYGVARVASLYEAIFSNILGR